MKFDASDGESLASGDDVDDDGEKHADHASTPSRAQGDDARRGEELLRAIAGLKKGDDKESKQKKNNATAKTLIWHSVDRTQALAMCNLKTANEMWEFLRPRPVDGSLLVNISSMSVLHRVSSAEAIATLTINSSICRASSVLPAMFFNSCILKGSFSTSE